MSRDNVFREEWLRSLRAQYQHVLQRGDRVALPSLTAVLQDIGFGEDELRQLRLEATLRSEDVAEDFVPDLQILEPRTASVAGAGAATESPSPPAFDGDSDGEQDALAYVDGLALSEPEPDRDAAGEQGPVAAAENPQQSSFLF